MKENSFELVVAHYHENLNWLNNIPKEFKVTIYSKNSQHPYSDNTIILPNIGREAHTYLYHITTHFNQLATYTVFCQGKPFDHAFDFHKSLKQMVQNPTYIADFKWFGHIIDTDTIEGELFRNWSKNRDNKGLDLAQFYQLLFQVPPPLSFPFVLGAQFAVANWQIQQRPLAFYQHALELSQTFSDAAHCFERVWDKVFDITGIDAEWLTGRKTVYLKKIKGLS